jgi:hypothetical protein
MDGTSGSAEGTCAAAPSGINGCKMRRGIDAGSPLLENAIDEVIPCANKEIDLIFTSISGKVHSERLVGKYTFLTAAPKPSGGLRMA